MNTYNYRQLCRFTCTLQQINTVFVSMIVPPEMGENGKCNVAAAAFLSENNTQTAHISTHFTTNKTVVKTIRTICQMLQHLT